MFENARDLFYNNAMDENNTVELLTRAGFADWKAAWRLLSRLGRDENKRAALAEILPQLLTGLSNAAGADRVLIYFDRFASGQADAAAFYQYLRENPRAIEILVTLFSSSQPPQPTSSQPARPPARPWMPPK